MNLTKNYINSVGQLGGEIHFMLTNWMIKIKKFLMKILSAYDTLKKYERDVKLFKMGQKKLIKGQGIFYFINTYQLLDRLQLLGGSILAGNNGVIPEFSQVAHLLNRMKFISKKQLNNLLKNYIPLQINGRTRYSYFFGKQRKSWNKQT